MAGDAAGVTAGAATVRAATAAAGCGEAGMDTGAGASPDAATGAPCSGSSRMKQLPRPGSLSTWMLPPMRSARSREIDRPRPVPP
ncbi:hypothetical protein G6F22_021303 [Rhizopus arrhizus]|nr:hypothetical protein G6F22_021303 [Rhizopus arrhizus]